jgi:hypothetical protein
VQPVHAVESDYDYVKAWFLSEYEKGLADFNATMQDLPGLVREKAKERIQAAALNAIADEIPGMDILMAFAGVKVGGGKSEVAMMTEQIISAIKASEDRIVITINNRFADEHFATVFAMADAYGDYTVLDEGTRYAQYEQLGRLKDKSLGLTYQLQNVAVHPFASNYHTFLTSVSLHASIDTEYVRMSYIRGKGLDPNTLGQLSQQERDAHDAKIRPQIQASLKNTIEAAIQYIGNHDSAWRQASDDRFTPLVSHRYSLFADIGATTLTTEQQNSWRNFLARDAIFALEAKGTYRVEGRDYAIRIVSVAAPNPYNDIPYRYDATHYNALIDPFGNVVEEWVCDIADNLIYNDSGLPVGTNRSSVYCSDGSIEEDMTYHPINDMFHAAWPKVVKAYADHKDLEYWAFLKRGYEPSIEIIEGWRKTAGLEGPKPTWGVDIALANPPIKSRGCGVETLSPKQYPGAVTHFEFHPNKCEWLTPVLGIVLD